MANSGPIVIVEDDIDDQEIISDVLHDLGIANEIIFFAKSNEAFHYLKTTAEQQFLIICDINLPGSNGLDFKKQIDDDPQLRQKSIPFIFFSTAAEKKIVTEAYSQLTVQGYFKKTSSIEEIRTALALIIEYWKLCRHPNSD